jgi:hypothetical protein
LNPQEMRPKDIKTIDKLIENNFTMYVGNAELILTDEMEFIKRARLVKIRNKKPRDFCSKDRIELYL